MRKQASPSAPLVVVADPMTVFRTGVKEALESEGSFRVVGAENLEALKRVVALAAPAVVLVDLELPPAGGIAAIPHVLKACDAKVVLWSFRPSKEALVRAIRAGASGFLRKEISGQGLLRALAGLARGEAPLSRDLTALVIG